jgi:hypothetical protein
VLIDNLHTPRASGAPLKSGIKIKSAYYLRCRIFLKIICILYLIIFGYEALPSNQAIKDRGVRIPQHGITGTPLHLIGKFADYGIRKGNVSTERQNIAHKHLQPDLMSQMKQWAEKESKSIKMATKPFKKEINSIPENYTNAIADEAHKTAVEFIEGFRVKGSALFLNENISS